MKAVSYTRAALKDLKGLPKADAETIMAKIEAFAAGTTRDAARLKGSDLYRLRHGDWRAIFAMTATEITVARIRHRREAYRS